MREFFARLRDRFRREQLDGELQEELRFHLEQLKREGRGAEPGTRGAPEQSASRAEYAARRKLGNVTRARESARERWSFPVLDHLQHDLRYALRGLRRSPGFTAAVLLTLGLGIGANAAMFNIVDQLMFRPYPYLRDADNVQRVYLRMPGLQRLLKRESFPYTRYLDLKQWTTSFSQYAAFFPTTVAVGVGDAARERPIAAVSASFFAFFDARPAIGRFFTAAEDITPVGAKVAVISFDYWQREFGGRDVTNEFIRVDNVESRIVGVTPKGFIGVADARAPEVFVPITTYGAHQPGGSSVAYWQNYNWDWVEMMVRRKPGVSVEQASADLTNAYIRSRDAARAINPRMPRTDAVRPVALAGALKSAAGPYPALEARTLLWVTGVAVIVLLIAYANVANLFFARMLRRKRETALRLALGVTRSRLAAQSLTESIVFAILGGVVGVAFAQWGGLALRRLVLPEARGLDLVTDWRTMGVAAGAALIAGLLTSFAPMLLAPREDISSTLKAGARAVAGGRSRLRSSLLVCQAALSVMLLIGAGLFVRSLAHLQSMPLGYDVNPVLMVQWSRRGEQMDTEQRMALRRRMLETAKSLAGVEHAAWASNVPLQGTSTMSLFVPGIDSVAKLGRFTYQSATDDYFATIGTRIIRGRPFTQQDRLGAPKAVVVSEGMARTLWPGKEALGQCMRIGVDTMPCSFVVGVAEDAVHDPVRDQPLRYYFPLEQFQTEGGSFLLLRVRGNPRALEETVRRTLQKEMPGQQYITVQSMTNLLDAQRHSWSLGATMFVAFGVLALVVAAVGLYGVISHNVAQRMHELGVRMALGAQGRDVVNLVMGQGLRLAAIGVIAGSVLALAAARFIQPLLFQQSAKDPVVFGVVGVMLIGVALVASGIPAARATQADPNTVLRAE